MPFIWTDGDKIGKPKSVLTGMMGAKEIYGQEETLGYLQNVRVWAKNNSPTARRILEVVDNSYVTIYLVGMDGGFTCFDNAPAPAGTVYMDLNLNVSVNPGGATGNHSGFEKLHPYVAFLHEVGHAVQFIETPDQFKCDSKGPLYGLKSDIQAAARKFGERNHSTVPYSRRREWFSQGPLSSTCWSVRLEYDNIYRHERPICIEAGEPLRDHYRDIMNH